jgi:hypothetical protein
MPREISPSRIVLFVALSILGATVLVWWFTGTGVGQPVTPGQPRSWVAVQSESEFLEPRQLTFAREGSRPHEGTASIEVRVISSRGEAIEGAEVYHASALPRILSPQTCTRLGGTDHNGILNLPDPSLLGHLWAVRGEANTAVVQRTDPAVLRVELVLAPAHSIAVVCEDLEGEPLPEICVMLSRLPPSHELRAEAMLTGALAGPDPTWAVRARSTDRNGRVSFPGVVEGEYAVSVASPFYELLERVQPRVSVPGGEMRVRLAPLLGAVVIARGDVILSHSAMLPEGCLGGRPSRLNLPEASRTLRAEYPGAVVIVSGHERTGMPCREFVLHLLLERGGPVSVPVLLQPLYAGMTPIVVEPALGPTEYPTVAFEVSIHGPSGTSLEGGVLSARRVLAGQPQHVSIPAQGSLRLPLGRWEIGTNSELIKGTYDPSEFEVVQDMAPLAIRLKRDLVPVRIVARGYAGELVTSALLKIFANGKHHTLQQGSLTRSVLWLPSGSAHISISAPGHKEQSITIEIQPQPAGAVMEVPIELEWTSPPGGRR